MKTNLARTLSVAGEHGLFQFVAQARGGAVAERLSDKKRTVFDARKRITSLADIAIYTSEGELKLKEVFLALQKALGDKEAPSGKAADNEFRELFGKAVPNYDADRFYLSHMRKVCEWYNELVKYASLDFEEEQEEEEGK
jgi:hypothetical protein